MPGTLGLLLAAASAIATPTSVVRPTLDLIVIVEPDVSLADSDLREVSAGVRAVWRRAADVAVHRPAMARDGEDPSSLPGAAGGETLRLVLTNRVRRNAGPALGWVDFVDGLPQPVVTVSVTEVAQLMHAGRWQGRALDTMPGLVRERFMRRAVMCAVAHEVGHYLLRSAAHSSHGLMQAHFSVDDIMDPGLAVARIGPDEIARVLQRVPLSARAEN